MSVDPLTPPPPCRFFPDKGTCWKSTPCRKTSCYYWRWTDEAQAAKAKRAAVRTCPLPVWPEDARPANWCRWCGGEIVHGRVAQRSWHDGREDEPDCKFQWQLHTDPRVQRPFIEGRDGLKCWDCGEAPERWLRGGETFIAGEFIRDGATYVNRTRYCEVTRVSSLELEHTMPLWLTTHLTDDERRPFFGPGNLRLRCPTCHAAKTAREAADRAKANRLAKGPKESRHKLQGGGKLPGKGQGPKMKGRGFGNAHRPLRSRNDLRRR